MAKYKVKNTSEKTRILIISSVCVLIFGICGLTGILLSGVQNETLEKEESPVVYESIPYTSIDMDTPQSGAVVLDNETKPVNKRGLFPSTTVPDTALNKQPVNSIITNPPVIENEQDDAFTEIIIEEDDQDVEILDEPETTEFDTTIHEKDFEFIRYNQPVNIILDMDINSDVDDVCALRIASQLDLAGAVHLQAVMSSTAVDASAMTIHSVLSYDGLPAVPVGTSAGNTTSSSPYWDEINRRYFDEENFQVKDSLNLYKEVLRDNASAGEKSRIITTGYLVNIASLLRDDEGFELVRDNIEAIYITGGIWTEGLDYNFSFSSEAADAASYVIKHSPVPIVFSTYRTIQSDDGYVMCGSDIFSRDIAGTDPVSIAFKMYEEKNETSLSAGRFAWDPMCVWAACLPPEETNLHLQTVLMDIDENGYNKIYFESQVPNCSVIIRDTDELGWYKNKLEKWISHGLKNTL